MIELTWWKKVEFVIVVGFVLVHTLNKLKPVVYHDILWFKTWSSQHFSGHPINCYTHWTSKPPVVAPLKLPKSQSNLVTTPELQLRSVKWKRLPIRGVPHTYKHRTQRKFMIHVPHMSLLWVIRIIATSSNPGKKG